MTELEEIAHLQKLQDKHRQNIHRLEEQLASYGMDRPLPLLYNLEFERAQLRQVEERLEELTAQVESGRPPRYEPKRPLAKPRRPVNWEKVGAIAGVLGVLIALGAWLVPHAADSLSTWLSKTPTAVVSLTETPKPTETSKPPEPEPPTPTNTPPPTPTSTPTPTYTPMPPTPTKSSILSCTIPPLDEFAPLWEKNRNDLGCPVDRGTVVSPACEEAFEGGHLFWRSDTTQIYIVYDRDKITSQELFSGNWFIGPREWGWDGSNPNGIGLEPPSNLYEPIGGLGWLWREYLGREEGRLGWATGKEYCFEGLMMAQLYQNGLIYKSSDSKIYALLHNDKFIASR